MDAFNPNHGWADGLPQFSNAFRQIVDLPRVLVIPPSQIRNHVVLARLEASNIL